MLSVTLRTESPRPRSLTTASPRHGWLEAVGIAGLILLGLALLMMIHVPAAAQEEDEAVQRLAVPYRAAELQDPLLASGLLARIDRAALRACGDLPGEAAELRAAIRHSDCVRDSIARATAQLRSPVLTRLASSVHPGSDQPEGR